jgi:DNA repair protein RadC
MTRQLSMFPQVRAEATAAQERTRQRSKHALGQKEVKRLARQMFKEWVEEYQPNINDFPPQERPVNRLTQFGPSALSTAEILAVIIGGPQQLQQASNLLVKYDGIVGLARAPHLDLATNGGHGIGHVTAARIKAALELGRRLTLARPDDKPQVKSPADAANLLMPEMSLLEREQLRTIILDSKNRVLKVHTVYVGNLNTSVIRVGEIFAEAIKVNAAALIVVHNHPSGDPTPSPEDVKVTEMIHQAGVLLDIEVLDHVIIGQQRYVSLKERGLGFP